ncbi:MULTISPECIES: hypothetical protein [Leptolyngbya]|uniref:hypothetical protein n=1 Tax=Leptolyngbya TaxID=47251 RepID=UPI0016875AB9|nr:hypothetical protein [Leptolyngbya sp. FACHB-1624]MBD1854669.1 hypothetical protein [Leptolyngbya sp. FACHB-1624]
MKKIGAVPWKSVGSFLAIASAAGCVVTSIWLSTEFIMDPKSVAWMNRYLPDDAQIPISAWDDPKSLKEVQADLRKAGLYAGEVVRVETVKQGKPKQIDILMPVFRPGQADQDDRLVELRAYRLVKNSTARKPEALQFVNQIEVREMREDFVTEPLVRARAMNPSSDRELPFTNVQRLEDRAPQNGIWLNVNGKLQQGDSSIAYGQVIYYNPITTAMSAMLSWTSPDGELPTWQAVPKGRPAEFVVNQTVGLEPDFQVYQLRSVKRKNIPFQLQPISLSQPAIANGAFTDALFLARSGLWSNASEYLKSVKRRVGSAWTPAAQAQMDLIDRHAKITKTQADQPWANVSQQILANLLDGRWERAAQVMEKSSIDHPEVLDVLKYDPGRVQKRINAALQFNPSRSEVQMWGALRMATQQGKPNAIAWLKNQPLDSSARRTQTLKMLNQLDAMTFGNLMPADEPAKTSQNKKI